MTDLELVERIVGVLREMTLLSEASAAPMDADRVSGGGAGKSQPPRGVRFGRRADMRDLSLATYWRDKLVEAKGKKRQQITFLYLAELDLERARRRAADRDPHESKEVRERRVLDLYDGLTDMEAALAEDCSESYIRKVRAAMDAAPDRTMVDRTARA